MAVDYRDGKFKSVKKTEYTRDYKKLKLQEEFLEKNLTSTIKGLKIDVDLIQKFIEDRLKTAAQRQPKLSEIETSVVEVFQELKRLKSMLQKSDPSSIKHLDVKDYGSRLTRLSKKMEDFKSVESSQLEILSREEESLDFDIREFERSIFFNERIQPLINKTTLPIPIGRCPTRSEVNDQFTELVARTGHTQGWSDDDHCLFLKMRSKFETVPRMAIEIRKKRPHLTNEDVVNHEVWHKLYTELKDKRKKEIAEWRSRNNSNDTSCSPVSDFCVDKKNSTIIDKNKREKNVNKKKIMIEEWKADRLRKSVMDEEQKLRLEKAKIEDEKIRRNSKRSEARIKMRNYRDKRAKSFGDEVIPISRKVDILQTHRDSVRLIKSFREQDERFLMKRLSRLKMSEKKSNKISETLTIDYNQRENSTLFKPTKVWNERCKCTNTKIDTDRNKSDNLLFQRVNYVKDIQRLQSRSIYRDK